MADITIIMPSYNKEKYIAQALDSIFMQETSYDYHIIVADDCSTDKTVDIVKQYQEKYPGKITILTSNQNQKLYKNVLRAYEITKTDYFCVLDPDDKWINPKHIQNALDFLEKNKDFTIYSTHLIRRDENGTEEVVKCSENAIDSAFREYLNFQSKIASTQTVVYRNVIFKNGIPDKMINLETTTQEKSFRGDSFRNCLHLEKGKAHYEPTIDAIYNITSEGIWTVMSKVEQFLFNANIYRDLWLYYDKKYPELLVQSKRNYDVISSNIFKNLIEVVSNKNIVDILENLQDLKQYYVDYKNDLNSIEPVKFRIQKAKLKIKMSYYLYEKLHKYLYRKGVL